MIKGRSYWADSLRQLRMHKLAMYSLGIIVVYILVVTFIYLASWTKTDVSFLDWNQTVGKEYEKPNKQNILGTDLIVRLDQAEESLTPPGNSYAHYIMGVRITRRCQ